MIGSPVWSSEDRGDSSGDCDGDFADIRGKWDRKGSDWTSQRDTEEGLNHGSPCG